VSDAAAPFAPRLGAAGFQTDIATSDAVPRSAASLNAYDLIVLDDVPLEALHESAAAALTEHVNATAGGLLIMGSARSLSPATVRSPLAAALPIDLRPRSGRRSPPAAIVIVFDRSGSMADTADGIAKIELARQAVLDVLEVVPSTDAIGVIAFSQSAETVAPLRAGHDPRDLAARLRALPPSGATAIGPAVETALGWLREPAMASAVRRHIVLISDGRTSAADADRVRSAVTAKGIEISVVALGDSADRAFLEQIARVSGGRAFFPRDLRQLPMLVAREAARVASGWRFDGLFQPKSTSHPLSADGPVALPPLHGYVVSAAKPDAESIALSHLDDPVLAAWRFGLGRVAVFTSDIRTAAGASEARAALDAVWIRTVRWITRQSGDPDLSLTATQRDGGVHLAVEAAGDRGFHDGLAVSADVRANDGANHRVTLEQSAPGRYEAIVALESPGPYIAAVAARGGAGDPNAAATHERRLIRGFYRTSPEARVRGIDSALLARIASTTGGRLLTRGDNPFTGARAPGVVDLRPWLLTAALLLFFFEVSRGRTLVTPAVVRQWLQTIVARRSPGRAA
jgi:Mg-chelatase subunit ChlD